MFKSSNVVAILENDVSLVPGLEELAEEICIESNAPLAVVKSYMLLARSDHSQSASGAELRTKVKSQVLSWTNAPGIKEVLHACAETETEQLKENLLSCEGIDRVLLSLLFSEFLTLPEIAVCMGFSLPILTQRLTRIAKKLKTQA